MPNKCKRGTKQTISGIEKSIVKLENNKGIPGDILSTYLPPIKDSFQSVKSIFLVDEGIDNVPDICENQ